MAFCEVGTTCHDFVCICQCRYSKQCDWWFCYIAVLTGWEVSNRYVVKNSVGQQVFFAAEESDVCTRQCCGNARGFVMHITDNLGQVRLSYLLSVSPESGLLICGSINSKTKHFLAKQTPPPTKAHVYYWTHQPNQSFLSFDMKHTTPQLTVQKTTATTIKALAS